jgi:hypothetical protein
MRQHCQPKAVTTCALGKAMAQANRQNSKPGVAAGQSCFAPNALPANFGDVSPGLQRSRQHGCKKAVA